MARVKEGKEGEAVWMQIDGQDEEGEEMIERWKRKI